MFNNVNLLKFEAMTTLITTAAGFERTVYCYPKTYPQILCITISDSVVTINVMKHRHHPVPLLLVAV
ncbi:hypothetical protein AAKU64_004074 [Undibacterium sp. GrIS 1.8]